MLNGSLDGVLNTSLGPTMPEGTGRFSIPQMVVLAIVAGTLSLVTVVGNSMVMISFKIDKQLQTISNYFLFSLAVADFAIGLISMPLFTVYTIFGYWPLGPHICDTWLALDYLASNASVLNLLIISFDRYFSVTRPLTYRAKRTTNRAAIMIGECGLLPLSLRPHTRQQFPFYLLLLPHYLNTFSLAFRSAFFLFLISILLFMLHILFPFLFSSPTPSYSTTYYYSSS